MQHQLTLLAQSLQPFGAPTQLPAHLVATLPELLQPLYAHDIFGENLLAIPAAAFDDAADDFEKPFHLLNSADTIELFESEFRQFIPSHFIQIGNLYGHTELVLLNQLRNSVHIVHVADFADQDSLDYHLENALCDLSRFIELLQPQTVCCLVNPGDYSECCLFEIRNGKALNTSEVIQHFPDDLQCRSAYNEAVASCLNKGWELHYAPMFLQNTL